jgi:hypothetical protein
MVTFNSAPEHKWGEGAGAFRGPCIVFYGQERGTFFGSKGFCLKIVFDASLLLQFCNSVFKQRYSSCMTTKVTCQRWQRRLSRPIIIMATFVFVLFCGITVPRTPQNSHDLFFCDRGRTFSPTAVNAETYDKQDSSPFTRCISHARKASTTNQRINTVKALQQKPCSISSHHGKHDKNSKIAVWRGRMSGEKAAASDDVGGGSFVRLCATNTTTCLLRFPQRRLSRPHLILLKL